MNEKIKQLAEQAGFHVADGKIYIPTTSEDITECQKKFVELIVRECCDQFVELRTRPADLAVKDVKRHFGVE